jgi:hypothetical protein
MIGRAAISRLGKNPVPTLEQFREKCEAVFRPELRKNKEIERLTVFVKR